MYTLWCGYRYFVWYHEKSIMFDVQIWYNKKQWNCWSKRSGPLGVACRIQWSLITEFLSLSLFSQSHFLTKGVVPGFLNFARAPNSPNKFRTLPRKNVGEPSFPRTMVFWGGKRRDFQKLSEDSNTLKISYHRLGNFFLGDFAHMLVQKYPVLLMGVQATLSNMPDFEQRPTLARAEISINYF